MQEKTLYDTPPHRVRAYDPKDRPSQDAIRLTDTDFPLKSKSSNSSYIRTTFYLPKQLHKQLKIAAAQKDRDMSGIIEELLQSWFTTDDGSSKMIRENANSWS